MGHTFRASLLLVLATILQGFAFSASAQTGGACLYALDPSADRAFQIAGAQSVYTACGIVVESTKSDGFEMEGSETLYLQNHARVNVVGGADLTGQTEMWDTISNQQVQAVQISSPGDPLASIAAPTKGTIVSTSPVSYDMNHKPANNTLSPGVYCGGLTIGNTNGATFTMSAGTYVMAGGALTINSQAVVAGTGVTVYNTSSSGWGCSGSYSYTPVTISGQANVTLSAPTSGALAGMLLFGNRTGCSTKGSCQDQINGGSTTVLNGALYFYSDQLTITGSNASGYMMLVADKIYINGNSDFGNNGDPFNGITVSVSPTTATLYAGQTQQFSASVTNTGNSAVTWSVSPSGTGTISSSGLYTAPASINAQKTVTITATSQADDTKVGTATMTLMPPIAVSVSPAAATLYGGQTQQFSASVVNTSNTAVTWSISPTGTGTVSASGLYTAPAAISTQQTVTLTATSAVNPAAAATATITLMPPIAVSVSPANSTLYGGQTQQFSASVTNTGNTAVTWTINPAGTGTVSASGLYTAPATISSQQTVTVTATSQANSAATSSATVTLMPPIAVSVTPTTAMLYGGQTQQLSASVTNTSNSAVTWSISPAGVGTISSSGLYTAPATVSAQQTVTITATSQANPAATVSTTITLSPPIAVSVSPLTATLYGGQTQQFAAAVINTANTAVTWSISPAGTGSISASGLYTAPTTVSAQQTVTITATSQASPAATASATVTLSPPIAVTVSPVTSTLYGAQTQQFSASVINATNTAVTWSISPGGIGTVSTSGLYTAPATVSAQQTVTITATSQANSSVTASATITLYPPIAVSVTPTTATLYGGQTQQFSASVINATNTAVTWSISPGGAGSISSAGLYTAPATISTQQTVTITATSQANSAATSTATIALSPPVAVSVSPTTAILYGGQTQQFSASVENTSNTAVTWSISPAGRGSISSAGLYTAPPTISTQQTVTITAASQASSSSTGSATITLYPAIAVNVSPATSMLYGGQTQQFSASVTNTSDTGVTWSISPAGTGAISASGLYTAPATISTQQTVAITATSQADPAQSAVALITLSPSLCAANGYSYERAIVLDHTKVPNTDQGNFPFLFNTTDPTFATTGNGGHVNNPNGYDIIFSTDPAGQNLLNYEMEQYNPATGQVIAWIRIPTLSHTSDTVLYMFYGNPSVATAQQNPTGVWDGYYRAVYHLANIASGVAADSTKSANNGTVSGATPTQGEIDGAASFNGSTSIITVPDSSSLEVANAVTLCAWINPASVPWYGERIVSKGNTGDSNSAYYLFLDGNSYLHMAVNNNGWNDTGYQLPSANSWDYACGTYDGNDRNLYVNGQLEYSIEQSGGIYASTLPLYIGGQYDGGQYYGGIIDEVSIASTARSADWIATEYNNQSSPSTFYTLYAENTESIVPTAVTLYGSQAQQFQFPGMCNSPGVIWSMPSGSPGTLSAEGLYTAPSNIESQQTVNITATTLGASSTSLVATVTLVPPVTISVTPPSASLSAGQSEQFAANVANARNTAVTWTINPAGTGTISSTGLYTAPASISAQQTVSISATSAADTNQWAAATITLNLPPPALPVGISLTPASATLFGGQTLQFTASVVNTSNTAVAWSISPAGTGTISASGLYMAPATTSTQQTVTITATSQADPTQSAVSLITLSPSLCAANGYSYERAIVLDHTKVPNTDQVNFPFLFNTTDPAFATTNNGGHVNNPSGYDMIFSTDPNGLTKLDHELESYNPATGQVIAWVRIPTLSHTAGTTLYVFYGNPGVSTSQENVSGVWDSNFVGVWHLPNGNVLSAQDSTANGNNGTIQGPTATTGVIDGGGGFDGSSAYIDLGTPPTFLSGNSPRTVCAWAQLSSIPSGYAWPVAYGTPSYSEAMFIGAYGSTLVSGGYGNDVSVPSFWSPGTWEFVCNAYDGASAYVYGNGRLLASAPKSWNLVSQYAYIGRQVNGGEYWPGTIDEVTISSTARSADWIATEYNNQSSPSTFYLISQENTLGIAPAGATLYPGQSQQFAASGACTAAVNWSMPAGSPGTLTASGLYTAPASIPTQQAITITATSQSNSASLASVNVTLMHSVSVSVTPSNATLTANQTQQITATVANSNNPAVSWTIAPAGVGTIDALGVYTAPATIAQQQTVTVTATSQTDSTKSASATITLVTTQCVSSGYGYQRTIVIDRTKIPNTDQTNFPFLFNTTDPDLASKDNGGHVANPSGYDIIFSTDPNGQTKLDHELEEYNPTTGQVIAWVRIPTLSHTTDTVLYLFYGNPNITASQQNPAGVWDSSYQAVYHFANVGAGAVPDSTINLNSATLTSVTPASGEIDGAANFNGASSYLQIPESDFPSFPTGAYDDLGLPQNAQATPFAATFGVWFKTSTPGGLLTQVPSQICEYIFGFCFATTPTEPGAYDPPGWNAMLYVGDDGSLIANGVSTGATAYNDNNWHFAVVTYDHDGTDTLYVDGKKIGSAQNSYPVGYSPAYSYFVGTAYTFLTRDGNWNWLYFNGNLDEVSVSSIARSGDWIQAEYNNQGSPSTFYKLYPASAPLVVPSSVSLYAAQTQQFAATSTCDAAITWTIQPNSLGTLSSGGLYTAPDNVAAQQNVTITATDQANGTIIGSASVTLLPPPPPITLSTASQPPYPTGTSQDFVATLKDQSGTPEAGVVVNFTVTGANSNLGSATTDSNGNASYTYTGANSGNDTIQAVAAVGGVPLTSNSLSASWVVPAPPNPQASVILLAPPSLGIGGLVGAFTDSNGTVIEPIAIGAAARTFVVPAGATQLQLGVDDNHFTDNGGSGFVVAVNGISVTVPPTAMPWTWVANVLNNNYQYGLNDGTSPVIAATGLTAGQTVSLVYQNGTVSTNYPARPLFNADGDQNWVTGTAIWQGAYFPTLYTTPSSYPLGQPITFNAEVTNSSGALVSGVPVTLNVTGANPAQYQATTDATGTATFVYDGSDAGSDVLEAQALPSGQASLVSGDANVTWTTYAPPPVPGKLTLTMFGYVNDLQVYNVLATDASGNPIPDANVGLYVWGVDNFQLSATTDITGHATFSYTHANPGTYNVVAVDSVNRSVIFSNTITGVWTPPSTTSSGTNNQITISISAPNTVVLPNSLQLNGAVTDNAGITPTVAWTQVSGPGTATFANPQQALTTVTFSEPGNYALELSASDTAASASLQFPVSVLPAPVQEMPQGRIGAPRYGATVSGVVPINVAPGEILQSGTLTYYPATNSNQLPVPTVLNANTTGSGQIGTLDTTTLANGSYWIQLQSTDANGKTENDLVLVTVAGNYKPGRVTAAVTDLVVPANGLAINIQRTYDSLNAGALGDFGYGWALGTNVNLTVDPKGDVTFTLGGQRRTFFLTPQPIGFPFYEDIVVFTPEPGFHGTLTDSQQGCPLDIVVPDGSLWECQGGGQYNPPGYIYTDPSGTDYTISANGNLQSIVDKNGNALTITTNGITSSTRLNVPFVRDSSGRITQITDPQGNQYLYSYDGNGNLASVTYPNTSQPTTYTYDSSHHYTGGTDFRGNALPASTYYGPSDTDTNGLPLNGRLESVTDALGETTSYAYDLANNITAVTYPPDSTGAVGKATMVYDSYGMVLSSTDPLSHTTVNVYDANHNLIYLTDPMGQVTTYTCDQDGNQTSVTYPQTGSSTNTTSKTTYNQFSEPTSTVDELGNVRTFNYDGNYNPQSVTDSLGTLASFSFNASGQMLAGAIGYDITQQPSMASQFSYDANGNMIGRTDALGRTTSYTYNNLGQKLTMTIPLPNGNTNAAAATTTYTYDPLGNLTQTAAPLGRTTSSQYDANGNKVSDKDALGRITAYKYDALNRLIETDYPDGTKATKTYDFRGNVVDQVDQAGHDTHYGYDLAGRRISTTQAFGSSNAARTTYSYDADGRKLSMTDPLGHVTSYSYDAAGNLLSVSGRGGSFQYAYDNARNRIAMTDGNGNATQYVYDARKRLVQTKNPDGTTVTNTYDGPGNLSSVTDQAGNVVQYTYDAANQLKTVVQVSSPNTSNNTNTYGYDSDSNLISLSDANGHTTQNTWDLLYQLTAKTLPDGSLTEKRQYDTAGNLISLTHFSGNTTTYSYDPLNRLLSRVPDPTLNEPTVSFTYTATGKRATMTDASGTTTYSYDSLDRLTQKATPEGTLNYTYDLAGNLASMSSGDGAVSVSYTWDNLNRLSAVADSRTGNTTYSYDGANNLVTATYPNGLQSTFQYDAMNRLKSMTASTAGYLYSLGPTGIKTGATELSGRTLTWSFDGIYRLTNEAISNDPSKENGSVGYTLDPAGNRLSASSSLGGINSGSFSFNADDQLSIESYDPNGNVTAIGGRTFRYDSENHLISANGGAVTLLYDGDGNRVAKAANGTTTRYLVDDLNPTGYTQVVEEIVNGAPQRVYTYGLQRIDEDQIVNNTWTPSFYGYDGFGTVRQLTNLSGAVTDTYEYDAFGNEIAHTGSTPNNDLYRGEQWDPDLGLYYVRARYYNPLTGRFMSRDPNAGHITRPSSLHKYLYASGDPVNRVDPSGQGDLFEYAELVLFAYEHAAEPGTVAYKVGGCITDAVVAEAELFNSDLLGFAPTATGQQIANTLTNCAGEAFKLILGPIVERTF